MPFSDPISRELFTEQGHPKERLVRVGDQVPLNSIPRYAVVILLALPTGQPYT